MVFRVQFVEATCSLHLEGNLAITVFVSLLSLTVDGGPWQKLTPGSENILQHMGIKYK